MKLTFQDKKNVLLKSLSERDRKRKRKGPPGLTYREVAKRLSISEDDAAVLGKALKDEGYLNGRSPNCIITLSGEAYLEEHENEIETSWNTFKLMRKLGSLEK